LPEGAAFSARIGGSVSIVLTYAPRPRFAAGSTFRRGGGPGSASAHAPARAAEPAANDATSISRLQSTAGNQAVVQLLTAQRDDEKKPAAASDATAAPKTEPKSDKTALRKAWADAGLVAGGPLFDLINDDLSVEKLVDMALPGLIGLAKTGSAKGFEKAAGAPKGEVKSIGLDDKEAGQVTEAVTGWAQKGADGWLKGADGKAFLAKAQKFVNEHPKGAYWVIVSTLAAAISGAVVAYFSNAIDPPALKKKFEVKGLTIDAAVDLGKFQEQILQSAKLGLSGKAGPGTLGVEGTAKSVTEKKQTGYELGVAGSYKVGDEKTGPSAKVTGGVGYNTLKEQASASVGAGFQYKPLTIDTTFKFQGDGSGVLDTSLTGKLSQDMTLSGTASVGAYGSAAKAPTGYKLALTSTKGKDSDKVTLELDPKTRVATLGTEQTRQLWGGSFTTSTARGTEGMTTGVAFTRDALKLDLKYTLDKADKAALDIGASGKGDGFDAAFAGKFGLGTGQLEKLTVHLGFNNPDETLKFLHDISIEVAAGKVDAKATETVKVRLKQIAVEIEGSISEKDGKPGAGVRAEVGWKLPSGLILGAGAFATYGSGKDGGKEGVPAPWMVGPMLSVSHEALPVRLVGGVGIPIGGPDNAEPVFGLSVTGNFDFWSEKKKKK
jgi:hypothetical protein